MDFSVLFCSWRVVRRRITGNICQGHANNSLPFQFPILLFRQAFNHAWLLQSLRFCCLSPIHKSSGSYWTFKGTVGFPWPFGNTLDIDLLVARIAGNDVLCCNAPRKESMASHSGPVRRCYRSRSVWKALPRQPWEPYPVHYPVLRLLCFLTMAEVLKSPNLRTKLQKLEWFFTTAACCCCNCNGDDICSILAASCGCMRAESTCLFENKFSLP